MEPALRVTLKLLAPRYDGCDPLPSSLPLSSLAIRIRYDVRGKRSAETFSPTRVLQLVRRADGAVLAQAGYPSVEGRMGAALRHAAPGRAISPSGKRSANGCAGCGINTYSAANAGSCSPCPPNSAQPSTSSSTCICNAGYTSNGQTGALLSCSRTCQPICATLHATRTTDRTHPGREFFGLRPTACAAGQTSLAGGACTSMQNPHCAPCSCDECAINALNIADGRYNVRAIGLQTAPLATSARRPLPPRARVRHLLN